MKVNLEGMWKLWRSVGKLTKGKLSSFIYYTLILFVFGIMLSPDSHGAPKPDASVSIRPVLPDRWIDCAPPRDISARGHCDRLLPTFFVLYCVFCVISFVFYIFVCIYRVEVSLRFALFLQSQIFKYFSVGFCTNESNAH